MSLSWCVQNCKSSRSPWSKLKQTARWQDSCHKLLKTMWRGHWYHYYRFTVVAVPTNKQLNTLRPRQNGCHFTENNFKRIFLVKNVWILIKISLIFCYFSESNRQYASFGSDDGLEPKQATSHLLFSMMSQWVEIWHLYPYDVDMCKWDYVALHDDVIKWENFPLYWPSVSEIHRSPVDSPQRGQRCGALIFSLICAWRNGLANKEILLIRSE